MKRYLVATALLVIGVLLVCAVDVAVRAAPELIAIRKLVAGDPMHLSVSELNEARARLRGAGEALAGLSGRILEVFPIARQNVAALRDVLDGSEQVLEAAVGLREDTVELDTGDLIADGTVDLAVLSDIANGLEQQAGALRSLDLVLQRTKSGWLLPPVWNALDRLRDRVGPLSASAKRAATLADIAPSMLAKDQTRTYLVMLINNAELRGTGGILSGVGTLTIDNGSFSLGDFEYYGRLAVDAGRVGSSALSPDLNRRFRRYLEEGPWINATASPDVPEVARYIASLYERAREHRTQGVIVFDPRGLQAMVNPNDMVPIRRERDGIPANDLADFVYSDAYARFDDQDARRTALLSVGPAMIGMAVEGDDFDRARLDRFGAAVAAGHIRVVSFDSQEGDVLRQLGADGDLQDRSQDRVMITVQNLGADKLDFWTRRSIRHSCQIKSEDLAECRTEVAVTNLAPLGLPAYVVQDKPRYALYEGYLEMYIPERAAMTGFALGSRPLRPFAEAEDGLTSLGAYFRVRRGGTATATVSYDLPLQGKYSLSVTPQPLAHDAELGVELSSELAWQFHGPNMSSFQRLTYEGQLDRTLRFEGSTLGGDPPGITGLWEKVKRFWNEPLLD